MSSNPYVADAIAAAKRAGIDPTIFVRQIQQESGFNPTARSPAGAEGIAQFEPGTARGMNVNPWDPVAALNAAAKMMADSIRGYGGDYAKALAAYNCGSGCVNVAIQRGGRNWQRYLPSETQNYIRIILGGKGNPPPSVHVPTSLPPSQPVSTPHAPSGHPAGIVEPHEHTTPARPIPGTPFAQPQAFSIQAQRAPFGQPTAQSITPHTSPAGLPTAFSTEPHAPLPSFGQPYTFSVPAQPASTPKPAPKPKTIFGIPIAFSVARQPSTPVAKPKATRPTPAPKATPKPATAPVSQTTKKAQQAGKRQVRGPF